MWSKQANITYLHIFFPLKGWSVASGDFNRDGKSDVIFGDPLGSAVVYIGRAYVIFGTNSTSLPKVWHEESLNGTTGFIIYGVDDMDQTGSAVSSADVNGDGYISLFSTSKPPIGPKHLYFLILLFFFLFKVTVTFITPPVSHTSNTQTHIYIYIFTHKKL